MPAPPLLGAAKRPSLGAAKRPSLLQGENFIPKGSHANYAEDAIAAVDSVVESLLNGTDCPPSWIESALDPPEWHRKDALWFEMTETFDSAAADDAYFGLDKDDMQRVATNFCDDGGMFDTLKYELTEDFGPCDKSWDDSEFGFSDEQLQVLWNRFGAHISEFDKNSDSSNKEALGFGTPVPKALNIKAESTMLPCTQALETIEENMDNLGQEQLDAIIGDGSLEQFIGSEVPELPRPGMRAFLLSTKKFDGEDWYLFKVADAGKNRFYMKAYADFEELHDELTKITREYPRSRELPELGGRDWMGIRRYFGGQEFESYRTQVLKEYLQELMSRPLAPCQEQVIRMFFGPCAKGRIMPPKGPLFRAGKSYAF